MHLSPRLGHTALVVLASAFAAPTLAAQASRRSVAPAPEVRQLEINGVKSLDRKEIEANISTTATRCISALLAPICKFSKWRAIEERHYLDRPELKRDVLRIRVLYYKHGFRDTQVDTAVVPLNEKAVLVRFDIVEGPPTVVNEVAVSYDSTLLSPRKVEELTLLKVGEPLDLFKLDSSRVLFQNELWELGHADALVDTSSIVDATSRTARVQYGLVPNHVTTVGEVVVSGADQVSTRTVLNALSFRTGDLFRRSAVIESQRNLYESSLFRLAAIDVPETFDSVKTVNVLLREAPLHSARLSLGFNSVDFVQTEAHYTNYNLLGGARRLELSGALGNLMASTLNGRPPFRRQATDSITTGNPADFLLPTWQTSATLTQPAFLRRPMSSASITAFAHRRAIPAVVIDRGYGGQASVTHSLGFRTPVSLAYQFEVTRVQASDPYYCVNFGVCDSTTIFTLRSHQRLSPLTLSAQTDRTDQPLSPTRGYIARAEVETAGQWTVSDYAYNRAFAEGSHYSRVGHGGAVLATHVRLGFVRPLTGLIGDAVLHPSKRFYAGGSQSVRGFGENQLGPRILTLPHQYLVNAKDGNGNPCNANTSAISLCDPNTAAESLLVNGQIALVDDTKFTPRPLGGTSLVEGSVEYRFPLPFGSSLGGAVFVDGAAVGERVFAPIGGGVSSLANLVHGRSAITPGFGVRYYSPVGPIRVDVGFNPSKAEDLAVVTEIIQNGQRVLVPLQTPRHYSPTGSPTAGLRGLLNRFVLHLSIGQPY
jgi:outer membrane protein insertion porin family/translocation and assembly module TamA